MTKKQFEKLKPATRRIKMAQDVILRLSTRNRPVVERGTYCEVSPWIPDRVLAILAPADRWGNRDAGGLQFQSVLPKVQKYCHVCAMGALLLSHVAIANAFTVDDADGVAGYVIIETLDGYFTDEQLRSIEAAFEGELVINVFSDAEPIIENAAIWFDRIPDATKRLRAICRNIIAHKGDFDITDVPAPAKKATKKKKAVKK